MEVFFGGVVKLTTPDISQEVNTGGTGLVPPHFFGKRRITFANNEEIDGVMG